MEKVLISMYKFLHKATSRCTDYRKLADAMLFSPGFSPTRWVENDVVADRGIQIWDVIVKLIRFILQKPLSSRPKDKKSFDNSFSTAP